MKKNKMHIVGMAALLLAFGIALITCGGGSKSSTTSRSNAEVQDVSETLQEATDELESALDQLTTLDESLGDSGSSSSDGGSRKTIDDFLKSYEDYVTKLEKAHKSNDTMALLSLSAQSADLAAKVSDLQGNTAWNTEDMAKYTELSLKAAKVLKD
jgi:hypothetical protein